MHPKWRIPVARDGLSGKGNPMSAREQRRRITVTRALIEEAVPHDSGHCMVADAIRDQVPGAHRIAVDLQTIRWSDTKAGKRYIFFTPPVVQRALLAFDQGDAELLDDGFTFSLGAPAQLIPLAPAPVPGVVRYESGKAKRVTKRAAKRATKKTVKVHAGGHGPSSTRAPIVEGGQAPPQGALKWGQGRRREFGVRVAGSPKTT